MCPVNAHKKILFGHVREMGQLLLKAVNGRHFLSSLFSGEWMLWQIITIITDITMITDEQRENKKEEKGMSSL